MKSKEQRQYGIRMFRSLDGAAFKAEILFRHVGEGWSSCGATRSEFQESEGSCLILAENFIAKLSPTKPYEIVRIC